MLVAKPIGRFIEGGSGVIFCVGIALFLMALSNFLEIDIGLNLWDEGFLWYGTSHTALGEVPVRDFQSYDPGRYYWGALWALLFGNGIIALRISSALFAFIGLSLGLLAARRAFPSRGMVTVIALILVAWMWERHKMFEPAIVLAGIFFAVRLIEQPTVSRHLAAGVFVGVAAFFGRNHGLYCSAAMVVVIGLLFLKVEKQVRWTRLGWFLGGIAIGYSPMVLMWLFVPGMAETMLESILRMFRLGTTNLVRPVPWPWVVDYGQSTLLNAHYFLVGTAFLAVPVLCLAGIVRVLRANSDFIKRNVLFTASVPFALLYSHYVFSRPDISHLSYGIAATFLVAASFPFSSVRNTERRVVTPYLLLILALSVPMVGPLHGFTKKLLSVETYTRENVAGNTLWVSRPTAQFLHTTAALRGMIRPDEGVFFAPYLPTLYMLVGRPSPVRELIFFAPRTEAIQADLVAALKHRNVAWAILGDFALDGQEQYRMRHSHPVVWQYLMDNFCELPNIELPKDYRLMRRCRKPDRNAAAKAIRPGEYKEFYDRQYGGR